MLPSRRNSTLTTTPTVKLPFCVTINVAYPRLTNNRWRRCATKLVFFMFNPSLDLIYDYQHRALKYDRMKLRHVLFKMDAKYKRNSKYKEDESDIDDEFIAEHEDNLKTKEVEKAEKKFVKENEKLQEDGKKPQNDSVLKERIAEIEEEFKQLAKERGTGKASLKRERAVEKIEESIEKLSERIKTFKLQMVDRDAGKEVALGTR